MKNNLAKLEIVISKMLLISIAALLLKTYRQHFYRFKTWLWIFIKNIFEIPKLQLAFEFFVFQCFEQKLLQS